MNFKDFYLQEKLLVEINESTILYHRSYQDLKPGNVLTPEFVKEKGKHWLESKEGEKDLEAYRVQKYPDRPSRFNSIFSAVVPKARFLRKGYLYEIKPIGKIFVTNSKIIDDIDEDYGREPYYRHFSSLLFDNYWNPPKSFLGKDEVINLEVLSEKAIVIRKVEESDSLKIGDKVELLTDIKNISWVPYHKDGNTKLSSEQLKKVLDDKNIQIVTDEHWKQFYKVTLPKGTKGKIGRIVQYDRGTDFGKYRSLNIELPEIDFTYFDLMEPTVNITGLKYQEHSNWKKYLKQI